MTEPLTETEQSFRGTLEDMLVILDKLVPQCDSLEDLTGVVELAVSNRSQLRLVMRQVSPKGWHQSGDRPAQVD